MKITKKLLETGTVNILDAWLADSDGLTLKIDIRLYGIDAPEYNQPGFMKAKKFLARILYSRVTTSTNFKYMGVDVYNRLVAKVFVDYKDVSQLMVINGYAWAIEEEYKPFQVIAQANNKGIWGYVNHPIPPWEFRKEKKNGNANTRRS